MKYTVKNFTKVTELEIAGRKWEGCAMVDVISREGNMYMQHSMTPEQARSMAKYLIASAIEAELLADGVAA